MREITLKFKGVCADTGRTLPRGARALYDPSTKKVYSLESPTAKAPGPAADPDSWIDQALINNYERQYH